jgi:glycosyltransferase involved in cell wall biosynthesis
MVEQSARPGLRIGINAHLLSQQVGYRQAGVSRYIAELVRHLASEPGPHTYQVFMSPQAGDALVDTAALQARPSRLPTQRPPVRIAWEQIIGPGTALAQQLNVFHGTVNVLPLALPCWGVVTIHDLAFLAYPNRLRDGRRRYLTLLTRLSARRAACVIAVSRFTAVEVVRRLGVAAERVVVVPNAAGEEYRPEPDATVLRAFRRTNGLSDQYVLFLGTLEPRKNVPTLLRAFAQIVDEFPAVSLVVAGGRGWLDDEIFVVHRQLGLGERVRFTGFVSAEDLPRWYQAATVAVYPSLYEGFGLPPLEAMACGTPVITSNVSAMPEVVGEAGLLVDPRDANALAGALRTVLRDDELRTRLRSAGLDRAASFSWARTARATRAVYESATRW